MGDREWFLELTRQLHKSRAIAVGGILRQYMRELEEKNQDLINESEETDEVDEEQLFFEIDFRIIGTNN
ncbi:protein rep [Nostoc sp. CHAB 5715]|uniref:protein rep n=1 Tax=Nostoc sp. CHAB 5715 TaxID=2780400 RepID=UPI001E47A1E2|nr:protein rep [Nostoc sp. CHAB 5715]MCC5620378.1 protein rep [Nostoc sp. CHAB 5715]